ncbi:MAG: radical SAM protein [Bdellovibrionota bacterium]
MVELARLDNILGVRSKRGDVVGFHAHNMQVAKLDESAWRALVAARQGLIPAENPDALEALSEVRTWNSEDDLTVKDAFVPLSVRSLAINIAQICNLHCGYCAAGGDGTFGDPMKEVDLGVLYEQIRMLLHDVPAGDEFKFTFLGGEPLVAPDAIRAIARFVKLQVAGRGIRVRYDIVTNGTLVTPQIADLLASIKANVTVSIDGPPEVNDVSRPTRGGKGSTAQTLKGIENLVRVKHLLGSLSAGAVFGKHHTGVIATWEFLRKIPFDSLRFDFAVGDQDEAASAAYVEELREVGDRAWTTGGEAELRRVSIYDLYFRMLDSRKRIKNHCGAGKTHLHSDTRGTLTTCQWFVGDKKEKVGEGTTIDHQALQAYADPLAEKHGCGSCWARNLCGGGCMYVNKTKTGSKHDKDTEFCIRTRSIIAKGIEYYAEARYESEQNGVQSETH